MRKFDRVCVGDKIGMVRRVLNPAIEDSVKVAFIDGGWRWVKSDRIVVLTAGQVAAVERRFGRDAWAQLEKESAGW